MRMYMTTSKTLIAGCFVLFFLFGCSSSGPSIASSLEDIRTGTAGLELEFQENSPPQEVFEDELFFARLMIANKGAYDLNGVVSIIYNDGVLDVEEGDPRKLVRIRGRSLGNPSGDTEYLDLKLRAKDLNIQQESQRTALTALACYEYESSLQEEICIETDCPQSFVTEKACETKDISSSGQGGPLVITRIEVEMRSEERAVIPYLTVHLANQGEGEVVRADALNELCSGYAATSPSQETLISIDGTLSGHRLDCSPVLLEQGKGEARCTVPEGLPRNFATYVGSLELHISYGYTATESREVLIKKTR